MAQDDQVEEGSHRSLFWLFVEAADEETSVIVTPRTWRRKRARARLDAIPSRPGHEGISLPQTEQTRVYCCTCLNKAFMRPQLSCD
jgi:hypothetical protein